jgi:hypothetical protein
MIFARWNLDAVGIVGCGECWIEKYQSSLQEIILPRETGSTITSMTGITPDPAM